MKKVLTCLFLMGFLLSACTFSVEVMTPAVSPSASSTSTEAALSPLATISATSAPTSETQPQGQTIPRFYNARLGNSPNDGTFQSLYLAGTKQVFSIWDYENMRDGLIIRREWYLDGKLWLKREELWDFSKYGANGTVRDISIYDLDYGLPSGSYQLRLFIDNVQQPIGSNSKTPVDTWVSFTILSDEAYYAGFLSPDSEWSAKIVGQKSLIVHDSSGSSSELFVGREIPYLAWLPDSRHILFVDRDRSDQQGETNLGIRDDLWIVEIDGIEPHLLYRSHSTLGGGVGLLPSSDGRYVAVIEGSGYADACSVDSRLVFFELGGDFQSARPIRQEHFTDIPSASDGVVYPIEDGMWQTSTEFLVTLRGTCSIDLSEMGLYLFDVANFTAGKK